MALQTILTVGKTYRVKGAYRSVGGVAKPVVISGEIRAIGTVSTSWQLFNFVFIATITTLRFDGHVPGTVQFDDITVTDETVACAAWAVGGAAMLWKYDADAHFGAQSLAVECTAGGLATADQTVMTPGKLYRIQGYCKGDGVMIPKIYENGSDVGHYVGSASGWVWAKFDYVHMADFAGQLEFGGVGAGAGSFVRFDDIIVEEKMPWMSVTFADGTWVAVATDNGTWRVMTSVNNGLTWTFRNASEANQWWSIFCNIITGGIMSEIVEE